MEHLSLLATTIGPDYLVIGRARLGKNIIENSNQAISYIDIHGHVDQDFPFRSRKSGNKTSVDFGWNVNEKIGMNPSGAIRIPHLHITRTRMNNSNIFDLVESPPDLAYSVSAWYGKIKS